MIAGGAINLDEIATPEIPDPRQVDGLLSYDGHDRPARFYLA